MAKRRPVSGFKTKSKKNKKSKKPKSKKGKAEKEKRAEKIGLGLKDICTALTDLKVDASACDKANASYKNIPGQSKIKPSKRENDSSKKADLHISKLFQKLSCGHQSTDQTLLPRKILGHIDGGANGSEQDIGDEDYAQFAKKSLSVNLVPSRKLKTELPPSGMGLNFIQNHLENEKSYKGRIGKRDNDWKRQKKSSRKNKGKRKTVVFLDECGIFI